MEDKKDRIIQSAIHVFREKGIEKTKISDIVKDAGIAQGTFYLYFSSKFAVMPSIAEEMMEKTLVQIKENVDENLPFSKQLETVVDVVFAITDEYREIFALIYSGLAATDYLKEWEAIYEPYYWWMRDFLMQAKADGAIREAFDIQRTAEVLIGLIESTAEQCFLYSQMDDETIDMKKKAVLMFAEYALGLRD